MTTSDLAVKYAALADQHSSFMKEIASVRDRFHAFLVEHNPAPWFHHCVANEDETPEASLYTLYLEDKTPGIHFEYEMGTYEGMTTFRFTIPPEYLTDPDAWEARMLEMMANDYKLVRDAYERIAPGVCAELGLEVRIPYAFREGEVSAWVVRSGFEGITLNDPDKERIVANSFTVNRETGEITNQRSI